MQNTSSISCYNCNNQLSERAKFCGSCRTQVRCKECSAELEQDNDFCIECATEVIKLANTSDTQNLNTISIRETSSERHIEAKFSNEVGKDLTGILRDAMFLNKTAIAAPKTNTTFSTETEDANYQLVEKDSKRKGEPQSSSPEMPVSEADPIMQYPEILNIAMKALPASEVEWVLVYSFYASSFGTAIFSREDIFTKYDESRRRTPSRLSNYAANIKSLVRDGKLSILTGGYSILEAGIASAEEILSRTKASVQHSSNRKVKESSVESKSEIAAKPTKKVGKSAGVKRLNEIDFHPEGKDSLEDFFKGYTPKNDYERILLFVYYMKEVLKIEAVTYDHVYTCFDTLDLKTPLNVPQITRNSASAEGWIDLTDSKNIQVTVNGKNEMRKWNAK